jgi:hypothetical protein
MRRANVIVIAIFVVMITTPGVGLLLGLDPQTISTIERRELAKPPAWSADVTIVGWLHDFERYFEDHFALRDRFIRWHARMLWNGLHTAASSTVIAGAGDWMFYADDGGLEDWVETRPFTTAELEAWRVMLERAHAWLEARRIAFLVVIAPDKQMIYPEKMPRSLVRQRNEYRSDQLLAHLRGRSAVTILDLRAPIAAARSGEILYHLHDTHWNDRGALVAANAITAALRERFPAIEPLSRDAFIAVPGVPSGDRTSMLDLDDAGKRTMPGLVPVAGWSWRTIEPKQPDAYEEDGRTVTEIAGSALPRALVFRDSFASRLIPYLSERFGRAVYLWQKGFDTAAVEREHPDVVILEMVARHLVTDQAYPDSVPLP